MFFQLDSNGGSQRRRSFADQVENFSNVINHEHLLRINFLNVHGGRVSSKSVLDKMTYIVNLSWKLLKL